jgi:MFS family permease
MASLSEVYEGGRGGADLRRLYLGVGMFLVGMALTVAGIVLATSTPVAEAFSLVWWQAREVAGIAAGVGLPLAFLGVVTVLPQAGRTVRVAAVMGSAIALFGVLLFWQVYPAQWIGRATDYTLPVVAVYFVGTVTTLWAVFTAVANFKTRNDPGGTVRLEVTKQGETRVVEVSNDNLRSHLSGIGFFGNTPDGEVETQTAGSGSGTRRRTRSTVSDGGSTAAAGGAEFIDVPQPSPKEDVYCGNCSHFKYVRTGDGMQPYCAFHRRTMDDMEPCEEWEPNNPDRV